MITNQENPFDRLVGQGMSSIEFVRDYIQLRFDGPVITITADVVVKDNNGEIYTKNKFGYHDILSDLVNKTIIEVSAGEKLRFVFDNQYELDIAIDIRKPNESGAVVFDYDKEHWWSW
jgi:hypothetical protein